jgi:hypothetical protein
MKTIKKILIFGLIGSFFLIGCGEKQPEIKGENISWINYCNQNIKKYSKKNYLVACSCEPTSDLSNDFIIKLTENKARQELAKELKLKVEGMFKGNNKLTKNGKKSIDNSHYEETIKQIVNLTINGSFPIDHQIFKTENNKYQVCSVVILDPNKANKVINKFSN